MSELWSCWAGEKQIKVPSLLKRQVYLTRKASYTISQCVLDADNKYEVGGILMGYNIGWLYLVVAATLPNSDSNSTRTSFLLDGAEHTRKVADITSGFIYSPSVFGIWHSHICDGHNFSEQDKVSNIILAKTLNGALSVLVTKPARTVLFSSSYISATGNEEDCNVRLQAKSELRVESYEQRRKMQ